MCFVFVLINSSNNIYIQMISKVKDRIKKCVRNLLYINKVQEKFEFVYVTTVIN